MNKRTQLAVMLAVASGCACGPGSDQAPPAAARDQAKAGPAGASLPDPEGAAGGTLAQSSENLKRIGRALLDHQEATGHFPAQAIVGADGKPLLSWRVAILPYLIGGGALHKEFKLDEPWDGPNNQKLLARMPAAFAVPGGPSAPEGTTRYLAFAGPEVGLHPTEGMPLGRIIDGSAMTVAVAEAAAGVPWTQPEDFDTAPTSAIALQDHGGLGCPVLMFDGSIKLFRPDFPRDEFQRAITRGSADIFRIERLLVPEPEPVGDAAKSARNLKQIARGLFDPGRLPTPAILDPRGRPLLSWRVALLPALQQQDLYQQFKLDQPWDSPHNKELIAKMPAVYALPGKSTGSGETYYQVFVGKEASFDIPKSARGRARDGNPVTILVVEAAEPVIWTKPDDIKFVRGQAPKLVGHADGRFQAIMWDGQVRAIDPGIDPALLEALITPAGGEAIDPESLK